MVQAVTALAPVVAVVVLVGQRTLTLEVAFTKKPTAQAVAGGAKMLVVVRAHWS